MNNIMTVKDLCLWYGQTQALKNINIDIPEKSITALIGPSGCGKSTFLKTLNRMNDLVQGVKITGEVKYGDMDIFAPDTDVNKLRKEIGMVFQKPNPFPMSIYDNIAYGPRTHGIHSKEKLDDIVERALRNASNWDEVKDRLKKSALGMSGGQQQRVGVARALVVDPKIIFADEPTGNLDSHTSEEVMELMQQVVRQQKKTLVMVTHDNHLATYADRVFHISDGKIIKIEDHRSGTEHTEDRDKAISGNMNPQDTEYLKR